MRDQQATPTAAVADQPTLQGQVDYAATLTRRLDKTLAGIDESLDRLTNRPPRPVDERAASIGNAARPSIEGALNMHNSQLEALCQGAESLLARLNRAV